MNGGWIFNIVNFYDRGQELKFLALRASKNTSNQLIVSHSPTLLALLWCTENSRKPLFVLFLIILHCDIYLIFDIHVFMSFTTTLNYSLNSVEHDISPTELEIITIFSENKYCAKINNFCQWDKSLVNF